MCIRDRIHGILVQLPLPKHIAADKIIAAIDPSKDVDGFHPVSYTHLRAHETVLDLVCRLLLEKKKKQITNTIHTSTRR